MPVEFSQCDKSLELIADAMTRDPLLLRSGTKTEEIWHIIGKHPYQNYYWKFSLQGEIPMVGVIDISGVQTKLLKELKKQAVAYDARERNLIIF